MTVTVYNLIQKIKNPLILSIFSDVSCMNIYVELSNSRIAHGHEVVSSLKQVSLLLFLSFSPLFLSSAKKWTQVEDVFIYKQCIIIISNKIQNIKLSTIHNLQSIIIPLILMITF